MRNFISGFAAVALFYNSFIFRRMGNWSFRQRLYVRRRGYGQIGALSVNYDVGATIQYPSPEHKMAKDQQRTAFAVKMGIGDFDIGLTQYHSGAIQLDGQGGNLDGCGSCY